MKPWLKVLLVTLIVGIPAVPLGLVLWPAAAGSVKPTDIQLPLFMFLGLAESLLFSLGVAFVLFGVPLVRSITVGSPGLTRAVFISIAWLLLSWWPHDGFHRSIGENLSSLLLIEYGFHLTLMIASAILAYGFIRLARETSAGQEIVGSRAASGYGAVVR